MDLDDTIVAVATPPGRGGIGVVRLSGPEARAITAPMMKLRHALEPGRAVFGELMDPDAGNGRIDEIVVTFFQKPHSYTMDDIVEISAHGSPVVLRHIVEMAIARGARLAEPGEFTMRAFLNGRIDLTQAEAVRDLIESQTLHQAKVAAQQLDGALSHRIAPIKQKLVELIALLEAGIDFADDDVPVAPSTQILGGIAAVRAPLEKLAESFAYGKLVHEGLTLAIVGRPNVGKSSLFNCLVERERAIVTATPGTTRDLVSETVSIGGIPVRLVDTAGIRRALDEAENLGVNKSREALADADLVLLVLDVSQPHSPEDDDLLKQVKTRRAILVENKIDMLVPAVFVAPGSLGSPASPVLACRGDSGPAGPAETGNEDVQKAVITRQAADREPETKGEEPETRNQKRETRDGLACIRTSALTGEGIPGLRAAILSQTGGDLAQQQESGFLTNARHQGLVRDSLKALVSAVTAIEQCVPHEMLLLDLYNALRPLDEIAGATTADDILNLIFGSFCIGK
jgi:tRNA modification GTPase